MQRVSDYNNFMFDLLLESAVKNTLPFRLSRRLITLLSTVKHPISHDLLILDYEKSLLTMILKI
jgi:hypothetical protein